jgi:hypothetical protein
METGMLKNKLQKEFLSYAKQTCLSHIGLALRPSSRPDYAGTPNCDPERASGEV